MKRDAATGFTLIELLTVVAIIAILAGVAYPSYLDHIRKGKRAEGRAALLRTAQVLERWYSDKATYATTGAGIDPAPLFALAATSAVYSGENAADTKGAYTITAAAETGTCPKEACYVIIATPNSPFTDATCGSFTLTSNGTRCWSTSGTPATSCSPNPANASTC